MSTRRTVFVIQMLGAVIPLSMWLFSKTRNGVFVFLAIASSLVGVGLMFYAKYREAAYDDRSETVSRRGAVTVFAVIALWLVFIVYRAMAR